MRKTFLDNLPMGKGYGVNPNQINWNNSIGCKVGFEYDNVKGFIEIKDYEVKKHKLTIIYNGEEYKISTDGFKACQFGKILEKYTSNFKIEIGTRFQDDKRDITIIDRQHKPKFNKNGSLKQNEKWYKYHCNKCKYNEDWIIESSLINGTGCNCCSNKKVIIGINDIPTTAPWMVKYFQGGYDEAKLYTFSSSKLVYFKCHNCGEIKNKLMKICTLYNTHSIACKCSDGISYPEKFMISLFDQINIKYIYQLSKKDFSWCCNFIYDFYLIDYNLILEIQGEQHYRDCGFKTSYKNQNEQDQLKMNNVINNTNYQYLQLDCRFSNVTYIQKAIFSSILYDILNKNNLIKINWNLCDQFATKNLIKEVSLYYKNNSNLRTSELSKIFKIHQSTIVKYLTKGNKLGWCNYNPKETHKIGSAL